MRKIISCLVLLILAYSISARAEEPIGGSYYENSAANSSFTIISAATNVNGLHIRTLINGCSSGTAFYAVPPSGSARLFLACNTQPSSLQGAATLPFALYLPPGYALSFTNPGGQSQIYMTYDLNNGP